jgi:hypothetical protein
VRSSARRHAVEVPLVLPVAATIVPGSVIIFLIALRARGAS